jgi:uncharacterized protein (DUF4415 family)
MVNKKQQITFSNVPKTLKTWIEKHAADAVYDVDFGGGFSTESGNAYDVGIRNGWRVNVSGDWMHTIIEPTIKDVIDILKTLERCSCKDCIQGLAVEARAKQQPVAVQPDIDRRDVGQDDLAEDYPGQMIDGPDTADDAPAVFDGESIQLADGTSMHPSKQDVPAGLNRIGELHGVWQAADDPLPTMPAKKLGRPKADKTKVQLCIRIDADILERFRASGSGWQTRMQDILRVHAPRPRKAGRK